MKVGVMGTGAVGSYYGAMLARAGVPVVFIGRPAQVQTLQDEGLRLEAQDFDERIRVQASADAAALTDCALVLCCVKSGDTEAAARQVAPHVNATTLLMSLQNGVDNAPTLAQLVQATVVPTVVYVATAMPEPGVVKHFGRGELVIGPLNAAQASDAALQARLHAVVDLFAAADVAVTISPDVMAELWRKLMVNCAYNAISGLAQLPYGVMAAVPDVVDLQRAVVREVVAVASADGVKLDLDASLQAMERIAATMPAQFSSTAQDMARGKRSEIDHLNGTVVRRGEALGVPAPVNQALVALVKLVEAGRGSLHRAS